VLELERAHQERFNALAERLLAHRVQTHRQVILFTSCRRAEGRSTLALTLARAVARRCQRAILVDADLASPSIASTLQLRPALGLEDVVPSNKLLADALLDAPPNRLAILPMRGPVPLPRAMIASPGWTCLMARLRRQFDLILLDGGPLFAGLSAAALHRSVDAAVLVHHPAVAEQTSVQRALEVLGAAAIPVLGLARTFCESGVDFDGSDGGAACTRRISA
jgi:Mrp family chromosome partitioning ATPase